MEEGNKGAFLAKSISGIMVCTLAYKLLGFIRELVLSYYFGTSGISDAYLISQQIPSVIFEFVGAGISTCFIPIYYKALKKSKSLAYSFTNRITTLTLSFSTVVIVVVLVFAPFIVKLFASGFTGETLNYAVSFTRICILSLYFSSFVFIYGAFLQANNSFMPSAVSAIVLSICILISIVLGANYNIWIMSIGSCIAVGIRLFFIIPASKKIGLKTKIDFHWKDEYVKDFFILMLPVVIGTSVNEINTLVDRTIASQIEVGAISALTYANSMIQLATGGIVQPFSTVVYPRITEAVHEGEKETALKLLSRMMHVLLLLLIPITVGIVLFCKPIIELLFSRGAFDDSGLAMTSDAFRFYSLGLCFIGMREMISRFYYACEDTKTPMVNSSIGLIINVILNLTLSKLIGLNGLALATSVSAIVTTVLLWGNIKRKLKVKGLVLNTHDVAKMLVSAIAMGFLSFALYTSVFNESKFGLLISIISAIVMYVAFIFLMHIEAANEAKKLIYNVCKKHK